MKEGIGSAGRARLAGLVSLTSSPLLSPPGAAAVAHLSPAGIKLGGAGCKPQSPTAAPPVRFTSILARNRQLDQGDQGYIPTYFLFESVNSQ